VTVKELMRTRNLITVRPDDDLSLASQIMRWAGVRHLPVVDGGLVVGILTARDLLRRAAEGEDTDGGQPVREFMTPDPELVGPEDEVATACALMVAHKIGCLPVVDGDRLVGIVTTTDIVGSQISAGLTAPPADLGRVAVALSMKSDPPRVSPHAPLLEAVGLMVDRDVRHVPVVDEAGRVVGIVSDGDIRTAIGDPIEALHRELTELEGLEVAGVMTTDVVTVREDRHLSDVARQFVDERVGAIPVVDASDRLVGIVTYVDVIRALLAPVAGDQDARAGGPSGGLAPAPPAH
jgi:CBS domain-containing protein